MLRGPLSAQKEKNDFAGLFWPQKTLFYFIFCKTETPTPLDRGVLRWLVLG